MTEMRTEKKDKLVSAEQIKHGVINLMFENYASIGHEDGFEALRTVLRMLDAVPAAEDKPKRERVTIVVIEEV